MTEPATGAPVSDAELVEAARGTGSADAFCTFVNRYKGMVMGTLVVIVHDYHTAEDLAQETFIRAFRALASLNDAAGFAGWLASIARNQARSWLASMQATGRRLQTTGPDPQPAAAAPAETANRHELLQRVSSEIESLPEEYKSTVYLKYIKGYNCREIAAMPGVKVGTVTSRLARASEMLRRRLAPLLGKGDAR